MIARDMYSNNDRSIKLRRGVVNFAEICFAIDKTT